MSDLFAVFWVGFVAGAVLMKVISILHEEE